MTHCEWPQTTISFIRRTVHLISSGYRRAVLVMYLAGAGVGGEAPLDVAYAFSKLKRWMAEGPTERNRKMAQFLLDKGRLGPIYSSGKQKLPEQMLLLIDLAVEWNDFAMWAGILKKSGIDKSPQILGSAPLIRGWRAFPFNVTRPTLVPSQLLLLRSIQCTHAFTLNAPRRFKKLILHQPSTRAAVEFILALRASSQDKQDVVAWCAQRMTSALSSIKKPSVDDVKVFVNIAKTEGLTFFSNTCVRVDGLKTRLILRLF